jgi:TonB family protein
MSSRLLTRMNAFLPRVFSAKLAAPLLMLCISVAAWSQTSPQLSLADLLVGLRSKKVSIEEKNRILADAVRTRGVTFAYSEDIEKELATTGADANLLMAVRLKAAANKPPAPVKPVPTPTPAPDFTFYKVRADASAGKGDFSNALADYTKSLELKADNAAAYLSRGQTYLGIKEFEKALADFDKAAELSPKDSMIWFNRGVAYEKLNDQKKALADYQKAVDLDAGNESAKVSVKRIQDDLAKLAAKAKPAPEPVKPPEFLNMGTLSSVNAVKMTVPIYSPLAQKANIEGKVEVEVELDAEGNVVSAKATTGHQMLKSSAEDAARRSKFKPAIFNGQPIKGKGVILYNFSLRPIR